MTNLGAKVYYKWFQKVSLARSRWEHVISCYLRQLSLQQFTHQIQIMIISLMVLKSQTRGNNLEKFELQLVKNAIGLKKKIKQAYTNQSNGFKWAHISPQQVPER